jgi:signal recognition particle receptor subunit beta
VGDVPSLLLLNKSDLAEAWALDDAYLETNGPAGLPVIRTSARSGERVDEAFLQLVHRMLDR